MHTDIPSLRRQKPHHASSNTVCNKTETGNEAFTAAFGVLMFLAMALWGMFSQSCIN